MFYIKLDEDMDLTITVREPIYRGDNLNRRIVYLLPLKVGEIDLLSACVYLNYVRADGVADVVILERLEEKYNESYYQYTFPIQCKLTKYPGEVCTWLQIFAGSPSCPTIAKSGECVLQVQASKNIDDYFCDHQLTALYQLQKDMEESEERIESDLETKADQLTYDKETRKLQLASGGEKIGEAVIVPADDYADEVEDTWSDMTEEDDGGQEWEPM